MTKHTDTPSVGLRLASMLVDHFAMTFISAIGAAILIVPIMLIVGTSSSGEVAWMDIGTSVFAMGAIFSFYYNKDILRGRSVAKRILKLQVVDHRTNHAATPLQCVVRNVTLALWPMEVLVVLLSPARRLGDRIAGTRVAIFDPDRMDPPVQKAQYVLAIITGIFIVAVTIALVVALQTSKGFG